MQLEGMKIRVCRARRLRRTTHEVPRVGVREPRPARRESANSQYHGATDAARGGRRASGGRGVKMASCHKNGLRPCRRLYVCSVLVS